MAIREPKIRAFTRIEVIGRDSAKKGTLELTPGNIIFSRLRGEETIRLTYQQLIDLLEKEVAYREIDTGRQLPKGRKDGRDFKIDAYRGEDDGLGGINVNGSCPLRNLDARRMNEGLYDIDYSQAKGRQKKDVSWYAHISIQAVLTILDHYIERQLVRITDRKRPNSDIVVSRPQLRDILLRFLKKLGY